MGRLPTSLVIRPSSCKTMKLNGLLDLGRSLPAFDELAAGLREGRAPIAPVAVYHAAATVPRGGSGGPAQPAAPDHHPATNRARQWIDEFRAWLPDEVPVHNFADPDALSYERIPWVAETRQRRLEALVGLLTWETSGVEEPAARERRGRRARRTTNHGIRTTHYAPRFTLHVFTRPSSSPLPARSCR